MTEQSYLIRPLFDKESSTWTYIVTDKVSRKSIIIDPVLENRDRDLSLIDEMNIDLEAVIETHIHADHITAASEIRKATNAKLVYGAKNAQVDTADLFLDHEEIYELGNTQIKTLFTPGHTTGCTSFYLNGTVFTGDALFIRGCGRTDFQGGSAKTLFESVRTQLFSLPDNTIVHPAHDYKGMVLSTINEEKLHNPRLKLSHTKDQFIKIMDNLNLPYPKKIDTAVPANLKSGQVEEQA